MKIHCQITPGDYIEAQYLHLRPRPLFKYIGILLFALAILASLQQFVFPTPRLVAWLPSATLGCLLYFALLYFVLIPKRIRKIYKQQKSLQSPYESNITEEAYGTVGVQGTARIPWTEFYKFKTGKNMILVYQSDAIYHIFPKRWFTDRQFAVFHSILQDQLGKSKN